MVEVAGTDELRAKRSAVTEEGEVITTTFLALAHGDVTVEALGDAIEFRDQADDWEAAALRLMTIIRQGDPQWFAKYPGPTRKL